MFKRRHNFLQHAHNTLNDVQFVSSNLSYACKYIVLKKNCRKRYDAIHFTCIILFS